MRNTTPAAARRWRAALILSGFTLALVASASIGWWYARESPPHHGPIVLVTFEGLGAAQTALHDGSTRLPHLEALAAEGVVFDRAYTHSTLTLPAITSLLTGQLPFSHGVRDDGGFALPEEARTLAEMLRNRGFATGAAVSSFALRRETGIAQGFQFFDADFDAADALVPASAGRDAAATAAVAESWLRSRSGQRYFLFVHLGNNPQAADTGIGRLVEALKGLELYTDATIIVTASHGAGDFLDDATVRVPLVIKQPDAADAGRRVTHAVQLADLLPTILEVVRAPIPSGIHGGSLRAVLDDDDVDIPARQIYTEALFPHQRLGFAPLFSREAGATTPPAPAPVPASEFDRLLVAGFIPAPSIADEGARPDPREHQDLIRTYREALAAAGARRYDEAISGLESIVRRHPSLVRVRAQHATLLTRAGRAGAAADAWQLIAAEHPGSVEAALAAADALLRAGRFESALAAADSALNIPGEHPTFARARAQELAMRAALDLKDGAAAVARAAEAAALDPAVPFADFAQGRLLHDAGSDDEALAAFERVATASAAAKRPVEGLHFYMAQALARLDRFADAETHLKQELQAFPQQVRAYVSLAMLYQASNRRDAAAETVEALLAAAPTPEGHVAAARLWTILGEPQRAAALKATGS